MFCHVISANLFDATLGLAKIELAITQHLLGALLKNKVNACAHLCCQCSVNSFSLLYSIK